MEARELGSDPGGSGIASGYVILYRRTRRGKWKEVARVATLKEAVAVQDRAGDWWLHLAESIAQPKSDG